MSAVPVSSFKSAGGNIAGTRAVVNATAAGTILALSLQWNPRIAGASEIIIPTSEIWMLTDMYTASTADSGTEINPQVEWRKDNDRLLDTSQYLLNVIITSNQRPNGLHGNLRFEGGSHMSADIITSVLAAAARNVRVIAPYEKLG